MGLDGEVVQKSFGLRLRPLRSRLGMSQEELAHLAELDRSYVGQVERGERNISLINISRLARALTVDPEILLQAPVSEAGGAVVSSTRSNR